ncbi:MAG: MASE1 domain-containing protein, partial [Microcoleaceae cyanobacterium]
MKIRSRSYLISITLLALAYYSCANLFSSISGIGQNIMSPLWPEVGISQAVLFLGGVNLWPGVALGEFFDALKDGMSPIVAVFRGAIAASQGLVGVFLLTRVHLRPSLDRLRDVLALIGLGAIVSTTVLPTLQTLVLCFIQDIPWTSYRVTWWQAWVGNAAAIVVIVPVIFTVSSHWQELQLWFKVNKQPGLIWEAIILIFLLTNVCYFIFASHLSPTISGYPLDLIPFIFSIWAALRFGQTGTVCVNLWVSTIAIWGTAIRPNRFSVHTNTTEEALLYLEAFITVEAIVSLILASVVEERQKA